MLKLFTIFLYLLTSPCHAKTSGASTNQLAISQGISSPAVTHTTLFSNGFTKENPVALSYQSNYRLTAAIDGSDSTSFGVDMGVGDSTCGMALGVYSNGCDGCSAYVRGGLSAIWGSLGIGIGIQEDLYTFGMILNANGIHRIGIILEFNENFAVDANGSDYNRNAIGLGYSMVLPQMTFSLDVSKQNYGNSTISDDAILLTPGVAIRVDIFSASLSYNVYMSDNNNQYNNNLWVGINGQITSQIQVGFYGEYTDRWMIMGSYYF
jgi:hypothetical protein